jgi:ABC-type multidrug transport system fused ATPase/permease subunit
LVANTLLTVNAPVFLGQFAIFAAYGIAAHLRGTGGLSVSEAVTALSLVNLLLTPLQELVYAIPETFSSMSCLRRIQEFLVQATLDESRGLGASFKHGTVTPQNAKSAKGGPPAPEIELSLMPGKTDTGGSSPDVSVRKLVFGSGASKDSNITTPADDKGLSFDTPAGGSLTMITGPVGCGKSTLLRAILGELTVLNGTVVLGTPEVAYCSQDPWVLNTSIRENIIGTPDSHVDAEWYTAVTTACAMDIDLARFPEGDRTLVGSKGTKLSGGQKQRIVSYTDRPAVNSAWARGLRLTILYRLSHEPCTLGNRSSCLTTL